MSEKIPCPHRGSVADHFQPGEFMIATPHGVDPLQREFAVKEEKKRHALGLTADQYREACEALHRDMIEKEQSDATAETNPDLTPEEKAMARLRNTLRMIERGEINESEGLF
jgi:hypothetical protein